MLESFSNFVRFGPKVRIPLRCNFANTAVKGRSWSLLSQILKVSNIALKFVYFVISETDTHTGLGACKK